MPTIFLKFPFTCSFMINLYNKRNGCQFNLISSWNPNDSGKCMKRVSYSLTNSYIFFEYVRFTWIFMVARIIQNHNHHLIRFDGKFALETDRMVHSKKWINNPLKLIRTMSVWNFNSSGHCDQQSSTKLLFNFSTS